MKIINCLLMLVMTTSSFCMAMESNVLELPFAIAPEYTVTRTKMDTIPSRIPEAKPTAQLTVEVAKDGKKAIIFYWDGQSMRDSGPMVEKESWPIEFLGKDTTVIKTSMFMGLKQEVLVLHSKLGKYTRAMIYSKDMTKEEFCTMLGKISIK